MPKQPIILDDILDVLDPFRLRTRIDSSIASPGDIKEWIYKLTRTLAELLKTTMELNENVKMMNERIAVMTEEIRKLRESFNVDDGDDEAKVS